jgi:hypothetical protein
MTIYQDTLKEMIDNVSSTVSSLIDTISQLDTYIVAIQEQINAITHAVTDVCQAAVEDILTTIKLPTFGAGAYVEYDSTYGDISYGNDLTGWRILIPAAPPIFPAPPDPDIVVYEYEGVGWDDDPTITKSVSDWDFGNDYLTRLLTTGASYGLMPFQNNLSAAKSMLQENINKLQASETIFTDYI